MVTFILRFIGIITIACLPHGGGTTNPCSESPLMVRVFIPDGRNPGRMCRNGTNTMVTPPSHSAVIVARTRDVDGSTWGGATPCKEHDVDCTYFPLVPGDEIYIKDISDGKGLTEEFDPQTDIRWSHLYPTNTPVISHDPPAAALASMTVKAGTMVSCQRFKFLNNGAYITTGEFPIDTSKRTIVTIEAYRAGKATGRKIIFKPNATVDIMNVPPDALGSNPSTPSGSMGNHFYLHYALADQQPGDCIDPTGTLSPSLLSTAPLRSF